MANTHSFSASFLVKNSFDGVLANSTQNGTGVDCLGYRRAAFVLSAFTGAATTVNYQLQDSPDNSVWTNVTGATLGAAIVASTADSPRLVDIDLAKRQRYVRAQVIGTGTAGNATANFILYNAWNQAVTQDNGVITI